MFHIALYEPEIPPNTGNIIRLCANSGAQLHLIHPLGFKLEDKQLKRAGLDYHEWAAVKEHQNFEDFLQDVEALRSEIINKAALPTRLFACTTKAQKIYTEPHYQKNDIFLFGPESRGLPKEILAELTE